MITALFVNGTFNVIHGGKSYNAGPDHPNYKGLIDAFNKQDGDLFVKLCDVPRSIVVQSGGKVVVDGDKVLYNGREIHNTLVDRMLEMFNQGLNISSLIKFLENLMLNPSNHAVNELYDFLEKTGVCISDDGYIIAYKCVRSNFKDKHTGTIDNSPGQVVKMERNLVSDNRNHHCSTGLHFGGWNYSGVGGSFYSPGDRIVLVKVHPRDVVSVPNDLNEKCRCCEYTVLSEVTTPTNKLVYYNVATTSFKPNQKYELYYDGETRLVQVIKVFNDYLHCRCLKQDKSAGQFRNFSLNKITNLLPI